MLDGGRQPRAHLRAVQEEEVQQLQALPHGLGVGQCQRGQQQGQSLVQLPAQGWALLCDIAQNRQDLE